MTRFKTRNSKHGWIEILGLDKYLESKLAAFKREVAKLAGKAVKRPAKAELEPPLDLIVKALNSHPSRRKLLSAGDQKDQLLRSLVPLYLARRYNVEVNSGAISRFWRLYGVRYATPNAAKALREHVGFAREKDGRRRITPNGIKYVEDKILRSKAA